MRLIKQNLGSNPKITCKRATDAVITTGFLYLSKKYFIRSATSGARDTSGILSG
jgi:hypothetical protein